MISAGGWLAALRPRAGVALLLLCKDGPFRRLLMEALEQRGHQVVAAEDEREAVRPEQRARPEVALLLWPPAGAPALMQRLRELDPDLEVVWAPPPLSVTQAEALVTEAADRARRRTEGLLRAVRGLLQPLPPEQAAARLIDSAEEVLGGAAALRPHAPAEPQEVLIAPDRRRLRVPLWEGGPLPDDDGGEDSGHRLELTRAEGEPELSQAEVARAVLLCTVGSLALTRAHCEQAMAEMYKEMEALQKKGARAAAPADPMAGRGLTASAIGPLERLAGVLAHELNNPLTFVLANLSCLEEDLKGLKQTLQEPPGPGGAQAALERAREQVGELDEVLSEAQGGAGRVREVVADLTTLGTRGEAEGTVHAVAIEEVVRAALRIAKREVQRRAQVYVEIEPGLPRVRGSASRLGQVLLNLLLNAVQAVPHGDAATHEVRIQARCEAGQVTVRISDTGSGIAADKLTRVFDPGFTTKPTGEGSGLGLAISREIVRAHGGDIQIDSQPGRGTTVTVLLPAAGPTALDAHRS